MTDLPQATQAVLKAVQATLPDYMLTDRTAGCFAAAALEAVADQVVPIAQKSVDYLLTELVEFGDDPLDYEEIAVLRLSICYGRERNALIRRQLLAIAAELRTHS